ncbi:MAG: protein-L-isoaspartate(D-aspartate) O-methyltransferase [Phycisphaerae bacterium]|nr:protein-L-isoaspartate(D-aspartate) O-methyltransferase [Phycisphaerae bacterium]
MFDPADNSTRSTRDDMIEYHIRARGIKDARVLRALRQIPRERFVTPQAQANAYDDQPLPIGFGQTISQPFIVAYMTEKLAVEPSHRVLEIGTGSGFQTALLALLAARVYTVERVAELSRQARHVLHELALENVSFRVGDGTAGWPEEAPYNRILVTAGAPAVPLALRDQLADQGRLIIPVGGTTEQRLILGERRGEHFVETPLLPCRFVQLLGSQGWPEGETPTS